MRVTLHLVASADYPAYAQLSRQGRLRKLGKDHPELNLDAVARELSEWLREPRSNAEIRERVAGYGVADDTYRPIFFARTLLPLVQIPPAGFWRDRSRPRFVVAPRPLPDPADAAALVLKRYLGAFGPASLKDAAAWAGVAQRDFAPGRERIDTVAYADERGRELLDLPGAPLPPAKTRLPVRLLARWDQALLAYDDRARIIPPEIEPLQLTLSGDQTVTVDGRVAASWWLRRARDAVQVEVKPHRDVRRSAHASIRAEAKRVARLAEPEARGVEVVGL